MRRYLRLVSIVSLVCGLAFHLAALAAAQKPSGELAREQVEEIVLRSYQYVATKLGSWPAWTTVTARFRRRSRVRHSGQGCEGLKVTLSGH